MAGNLRISQIVGFADLSHAAVLDAVGFQFPGSHHWLALLRLGEVDAVVAGQQAKVGESGEIVPPVKMDDTGIAQVEPWIARVKFKHLKPAARTQDGEGCFAWDLRRALRHPHQQPGLSLVAKDARIQQACHFHALYARMQIPR